MKKKEQTKFQKLKFDAEELLSSEMDVLQGGGNQMLCDAGCMMCAVCTVCTTCTGCVASDTVIIF